MSIRQAITSSTFWVPLLASMAILAVCFGLYEREADQIAKGVLDRESRRTEIFASFFARDVREVINDLEQLAVNDGLRAYLATGQKADIARAVHEAWFFSRQNPNYDQIRYIDEKGMEVFRVNWNGEVVPSGDLQDKASRPYFQKTNALAAGQFYISTLDLNIEHGRVEQPFKPTIRVAMPIFDATGKHRGVYIINYLAAASIDHLRQFAPQYQQRLRILSPGGYWIAGPNPQSEWGFVLPERAGLTLARTDPVLWANISSHKEGQTPYGGGYFTWCRVVPSEIKPDVTSSVLAEDDYLVIASQISGDEWNNYFFGLRETFLVVAGVLLVLLAASWRFLRARQQAQRELDRFFNTTRDMVFIAGFDGYFKRVNPAAEETLGYTSEELTSRPFIEFVHPDDRDRTRAETKHLVRGGETILFENRYRTKDGQVKWLSWSARPVAWRQTIFASARDLTEQKKAAERIQKLSEGLKKRAEQLEAANRELEAFSYSVSHDLRAPLRHIHGFIELLQASPTIQADASSRRHMEIITKAAREMGLLIDDLLAFSRTGRVEMHPVKIDMREMLGQVIREASSEAKGRNIVWDIKPLPKVDGDANLLRLVWVNLISNALKYTRPREEVWIEIGHRVENKDGREEHVFYVKDNGVGFDMAYASKLFGVFQRLHRATDFEGTGIGLANVQRIVHRHGGRVWAESIVGKGSTFYFSLPLTLNPGTDDIAL